VVVAAALTLLISPRGQSRDRRTASIIAAAAVFTVSPKRKGIAER
jgi:hypothetical protein